MAATIAAILRFLGQLWVEVVLKIAETIYALLDKVVINPA